MKTNLAIDLPQGLQSDLIKTTVILRFLDLRHFRVVFERSKTFRSLKGMKICGLLIFQHVENEQCHHV